MDACPTSSCDEVFAEILYLQSTQKIGLTLVPDVLPQVTFELKDQVGNFSSAKLPDFSPHQLYGTLSGFSVLQNYSSELGFCLNAVYCFCKIAQRIGRFISVGLVFQVPPVKKAVPFKEL